MPPHQKGYYFGNVAVHEPHSIYLDVIANPDSRERISINHTTSRLTVAGVIQSYSLSSLILQREFHPTFSGISVATGHQSRVGSTRVESSQ